MYVFSIYINSLRYPQYVEVKSNQYLSLIFAKIAKV